MKADLHIHSKYSYDSLLHPKKILKTAKKRGLDIIAITDHETIRGGVETFNLNSDADFLVIIGCEVNTEVGDIIGLHLNEEIKSRNSIEVIEEIKSQGGYVILPHPFRGHKLQEVPFQKIDAIEVFNSRSTLEQNANALKLARELQKPFVAGSDAHFAAEIGLGRIIINNKLNDITDIFISNEKNLITNMSFKYHLQFSQMIKNFKKRRNLIVQIENFHVKIGKNDE